ncbi:poly-gamma-glutamate biosynthesis protein PgsC [candidate division KSB1 bacterium]
MGYEISFISLLITLLFTGITGIYPGGIIVPGYLVLFADQPLRIAATLAAALLTMFTYKLASQHLILFGRRRFVFMILAGGVWTYIWLQVFPVFDMLSPEFRVIGWVIPGLIANNFERQGVIITTASLLSVTAASWVLGRLIFSIF